MDNNRTCGDCAHMRARIPIGTRGRICYAFAVAFCDMGLITDFEGRPRRPYTSFMVKPPKGWRQARKCKHFKDMRG